MRSALFVDFDNVYTQLRQISPMAAERFARQPVDWIHWLTSSLAVPDDLAAPGAHPSSAPSGRRRLLVRRCYLNPNWYQKYRHAFLRAGFEIVDCPPVTSQGKTSTDIHMVLDIVELLQHETHFEEFIVVSADADFTPVLLKLRRHDRRTSVLAVGFPSATYKASADVLIDERQFIEQALGLAPDDGEHGVAADDDLAPASAGAPSAALPALASAAMPAAMPAELPAVLPAALPAAAGDGLADAADAPAVLADAATALAAGGAAVAVAPTALTSTLPAARTGWSTTPGWPVGRYVQGSRGLPPGGSFTLSGHAGMVLGGPQRMAGPDDLAAVSRRIQALVAQSPVPLAAGHLASQLRREFWPLLDNWNGHGSFKPFFRALGLSQLSWLNGSGGRVADPTRHVVDGSTLPEPEPSAQWGDDHALFHLAREVSGLTGAPLLPPAAVRAVLELLCEDLQQHPYEPTETARRIVAGCPARCGIEIGMRDAVFLLRGMQLNGHVFGQGQDDVRTLARRLVNQMLFLCEREQMVLGEAQVAGIRRWIAGDWLN